MFLVVADKKNPRGIRPGKLELTNYYSSSYSIKTNNNTIHNSCSIIVYWPCSKNDSREELKRINDFIILQVQFTAKFK